MDGVAPLDELCAGFSKRLGARRSWLVTSTAEGVLSLVRNCAEGEGMPLLSCTSLGGDPLRCDDVRALARRVACEPAALLACDNSLATSFGCAASRLGADVVVESLGRLAGEKGLCVVSLSERACGFGWLFSAIEGMPDAGEAALACVAGKLVGFDERRRRENDNAQVVAAYLRCHPRVREVRYPGIKSDDSHEVAARQLQNGFGPCVDYALDKGGWHRVACDDGDVLELVMRLEQQIARG